MQEMNAMLSLEDGMGDLQEATLGSVVVLLFL